MGAVGAQWVLPGVGGSGPEVGVRWVTDVPISAAAAMHSTTAVTITGHTQRGVMGTSTRSTTGTRSTRVSILGTSTTSTLGGAASIMRIVCCAVVR